MSNSGHRLARVALGGLLVAATIAFSASVGHAATRTVRRVASVTLVGHGWGPGIGMGQWGDFGYAIRYHLSYQQILAHYYGETELTTLGAIGRAANPTISVVILENLNLQTNVGYDPVVTSAGAFSVTSGATTPGAPAASGATGATGAVGNTGSSSTSQAAGSAGVSGASGASGAIGPSGAIGNAGAAASGPTGVTGWGATGLGVPAGEAIDLRLQSDGTWSAFAASSCSAARSSAAGGTPVATGLLDPIVAPATGSTAPLTLCRHDGVDESLAGDIQAYDRSGYERTLNVLPLDQYLEGVVPAEESASWGEDGGSVGAPQGQAWGFQALEAQAVAARSYALAYAAAGGWNGYADVCDSDECQAYVGLDYETATSDLAVTDTSGQVLVSGATGTGIVSARYSASTGGWTSPGAFPAVVDLGDACVVPGQPLECNPDHTWQVTVSGAAITRQYRSVGTLQRVRVVERSRRGALGGRALEVLLTGTKARLTVSGVAFASALGLKSNWFAVQRIKTAKAAVAVSPAGATGTSGTTGTSGASGPSGVTGPAGASLVAGPSGASGTAG